MTKSNTDNVVRLPLIPPQTRADCEGGLRPCPWAKCRHHLPSGACTLDVVAANPDGLTTEAIAAELCVTRQMAEKIIASAERKLAGRAAGIAKALFGTLALLSVGCADTTPDSDVQYSFSGPHAVELWTHANNALAELQPHLPYQLQARDPEVTGVTWRSAEQWRIVSAPDGTVISTPSGQQSVLGCTSGTALATTPYHLRTIYVSECAFGPRWDVGAVVRHEIGHSLGFVGHLAGEPDAILRPKAGRGGSPTYTDSDIAAIVGAQHDQTNTLLDACWVD